MILRAKHGAKARDQKSLLLEYLRSLSSLSSSEAVRMYGCPWSHSNIPCVQARCCPASQTSSLVCSWTKLCYKIYCCGSVCHMRTRGSSLGGWLQAAGPLAGLQTPKYRPNSSEVLSVLSQFKVIAIYVAAWGPTLREASKIQVVFHIFIVFVIFIHMLCTVCL